MQYSTLNELEYVLDHNPNFSAISVVWVGNSHSTVANKDVLSFVIQVYSPIIKVMDHVSLTTVYSKNDKPSQEQNKYQST